MLPLAGRGERHGGHSGKAGMLFRRLCLGSFCGGRNFHFNTIPQAVKTVYHHLFARFKALINNRQGVRGNAGGYRPHRYGILPLAILGRHIDVSPARPQLHRRGGYCDGIF